MYNICFVYRFNFCILRLVWMRVFANTIEILAYIHWTDWWHWRISATNAIANHRQEVTCQWLLLISPGGWQEVVRAIWAGLVFFFRVVKKLWWGNCSLWFVSEENIFHDRTATVWHWRHLPQLFNKTLLFVIFSSGLRSMYNWIFMLVLIALNNSPDFSVNM